ncbi:tRNA (adenosine(37)-N6)-threonylcarbamoyltransferase complex dimerization subunit type 1 TsaB [Myxosarcina sp. GI1]|uniref:tRNA (adenosine(37)-N6)-threonylcarbamoyltransferase complex dimerization subunit type 1 TsaB n=1 Tax=Myxosarcina sp. GI1 TaxID=1541065 RepID=UPI00056A36E0|nr:tRNA (adenosine(37)-N6)-threonylcarbamoyltransferase complex dimerization subunit type 1 TsaB [Myxosarcina sp. GI1]
MSSSDKYALALHTTTPYLGIAIDNRLGDCREQTWNLGRDLSSHLHLYLQEMLQPQTWQDLKYVAVARGPGGFTGTRVGVATARTIAQQLDIPLFGISTLAAIAFAAVKNYNSNKLLAVQMPARQGQLFVAIYQFDSSHTLQVRLADTTMTLENWQATLASLTEPYQTIEAPENLATTVTALIELAEQQWQQQKFSYWSEVIPFYGQSPV